MDFYCQESISLFQLSLNIIRSAKMIFNVFVFMTQTIYVFVNQTIIVSIVSYTILTLIIVTDVCLEENVFTVIWKIPMTSFAFVPLVIKDIDVNLVYKHLASLSIQFLSITQKKWRLSMSL